MTWHVGLIGYKIRCYTILVDLKIVNAMYKVIKL